MALNKTLANPAFRINLLAESVSIRILYDIPPKIFPRVSVNALLVIMLPFDGTKLSFVMKQEKVIIEVHKTQKLHFYFLRRMSLRAKNSILTV